MKSLVQKAEKRKRKNSNNNNKGQEEEGEKWRGERRNKQRLLRPCLFHNVQFEAVYFHTKQIKDKTATPTGHNVMIIIRVNKMRYCRRLN